MAEAPIYPDFLEEAPLFPQVHGFFFDEHPAGAYQYIHEDRYGNKHILHAGDNPLSKDEVDDLLAASRARLYNPQNTGDEYRLNLEGLTDRQKEIATAAQVPPKFTQAQLDEWKDYGDPTKNINYTPPADQPSIATTPAPVADPRFPTRDPVTGRVTPAVAAAVVAKPVTVSDDSEDNDSDKRSRVGRVLNGIFGSHSDDDSEDN